MFRMKSIVSLITFLPLLSCAAPGVMQNTLVLQYDEFGPQVVAHELIGMEWWQWQSHGDSRPRKYNVKVVVYKSVSLQEVKRSYPVLPEKQQDYRYVEYRAALDYLDKLIIEDAMEPLIRKLTITKSRISRTLASK